MLAEGDDSRLFLNAQNTGPDFFSPHRRIINAFPVPPLGYRLRVDPVLLTQFRDRSLRSLYRCSDCVAERLTEEHGSPKAAADAAWALARKYGWYREGEGA